MGSLLAILGLLVATSLTFSTLLSTDEIPTYRDLLFFTLPLKHFLHDRLLRGELPLWNPLLLMGTPFMANLQGGVFYPPSLLLLLPFPLGFNLFLFAQYVIALLGAWAWLRDRDLDVIPAAIGTAVFTLGGFLVSLLNLTNHLQAAVWAPWVLLCWNRFARRSRPSDFLLLVLALCLQFFGGSPENLLLTVLVVAASIADRRLTLWREMIRLFGYLVVAATTAAALCAIQILPTLEYIAQSGRAGTLSFASITYYCLQPVSGLQLLFPHSSALLPSDATNSLGPSFEAKISLIQSYYLGIVPLCLAIVGVVTGRERKLWGVLILVGVVIALGDHTPVFPSLYRAFPDVVGKFRYPEKFYLLVHLGATALAAEGARLVVARHSPSVRLIWIIMGTLMSIALALYALRWFWPATYLDLIAILRGLYLPPSQVVSLALDTYWKAQRMALVLSVLAALLVLRRSVLQPATASWLLLALVLVDLVSANRNLNLQISWSMLAARPLLIDPISTAARGERIFHGQRINVATADAPQESARLGWWVPMIQSQEDLDAHYRMLWGTMNSDGGMVYGLANVSGSDGMTRKSDDLLTGVMEHLPLDRSMKLLRIFGAGYVIGPDSLPTAGVSEVAVKHETPYHAMRIHGPLPLVYAVSRLRVEPSDAAALFTMSREDFEPGREAIVEALPPHWLAAQDNEDVHAVSMLERRDGLWRFRVAATAPALVVVNESFFPGWEAQVDGSPATILRTNAIVRGVAVGPGSHLVELAYRPRSFREGAAVSLTTLCILSLAVILLSRRAGRASRGSSAR